MGKFEVNDKFLKEFEIGPVIRSISDNSKIEVDTSKIISFLLRFNMIGAIWLPEKLHFLIRTFFKNDLCIENQLNNSVMYYSLCTSIISDCTSLTFEEIGLNLEKISESINLKIKAHLNAKNISELNQTFCKIDLKRINEFCSNKYAYVSMTSGVEI